MPISSFFISAFLLELVSAQRNYGFAGGNSGVFGDEAAAESTSLEVAIKASGSPPTFISAAALTGPLILPADYLSSTLITPLQIGKELFQAQPTPLVSRNHKSANFPFTRFHLRHSATAIQDPHRHWTFCFLGSRQELRNFLKLQKLSFL